MYPEVYSPTYLWNKWFGVAAHMVDASKIETSQIKFSLSAPSRPPGDFVLQLSVTDVVQTGSGTASAAYVLPPVDPARIDVTVTASGTDVLAPVIYKARYSAVWVRRPTSPNPAPVYPLVARGDTMNPGEVLYLGQSLRSANGRYTLILQWDHNLVLYGPTRALWATGTDHSLAAVCTMQTDGNLVLTDTAQKPVWASNTWVNPGSRLVVQDDGNLVLYRPDNRAVWASNTVQ
jgi:hypothetical protein